MKKQIVKDLLNLKNGELYKIVVNGSNIPYFVGITQDGKNALMGTFITPENLLYKNVHQSRVYNNIIEVINKLSAWKVL